MPEAAGVNRSVSVHLAPTPRLAPQLFATMLKSPVTVAEPSTMEALPLLASVTVVAAEVTPTAVFVKVMVEGEKVTMAAPVAVPVSVMACEESASVR